MVPMPSLLEHPVTRNRTSTQVIRVVAALSLLGLGVGILALNMTESEAAKADFLRYWAAAKQLNPRATPSAPTATKSIEQSAGYPLSQPAFMRTPPVAFFLVM